MTALSSTAPSSPARTSPAPITYLQTGLALVSATVFALRAVRTGIGQAVPETDTPSHLLGAAVAGGAGALAVLAAILLLAGRRRPALAALAVTLILELLVVDRFAAPPRLVTALPLGLALVLFLVERPRRAGALRTAAAVVALVLMLPIGFLYLMSGLVVPAPDLFGMYALFAALFVGAAMLARRQSWWALAMPAVGAGLWFLLIWLGGEYWGWQA